MVARLVVTLALLVVSEPAPRTTSQNAPQVVELNGQPFATAMLLRPSLPWRPAEAYIAVRDLRAAVDGPSPTGRSRLRLEDGRLLATSTGGCDGCRIRVARAVLVSGGVRFSDGVAYVPLADLVRAFEGRLDVDAATGTYRIHVGVCRWCVLAFLDQPATPASRRRVPGHMPERSDPRISVEPVPVISNQRRST